MAFKKKPPKPPKATLDELLQSGAVVVGSELMHDQQAKEAELLAFDEAVKVELSNRKSSATKST